MKTVTLFECESCGEEFAEDVPPKSAENVRCSHCNSANVEPVGFDRK